MGKKHSETILQLCGNRQEYFHKLFFEGTQKKHGNYSALPDSEGQAENKRQGDGYDDTNHVNANPEKGIVNCVFSAYDITGSLDGNIYQIEGCKKSQKESYADYGNNA